jgi:alpha-galactosidase
VTQHPDWYWSGRSPVSFHLDLTKKEVQDGLIEMLSHWIEKLDIRWLRWDNNQAHGSYWDQLDPTGKIQFAYVEGLYRVYRTLVERHPNLMIDNCAGGGNRSDFGTLRWSGTMVISDHAEDPHICRIMQTGGARFLPGNYMNSSIYCSERDPAGRTSPFVLMSRFCGAISLSGHLSHWTKEHTQEVKHYLDGFKRFRHLLMKDFHRLASYPRTPGDWDVVQFLDPESGEAVILAYRCEGNLGSVVVNPKRLKTGITYAVTDPFSEKILETQKAENLMEKGLSLELEPHSAVIRHLKAKD